MRILFIFLLLVPNFALAMPKNPMMAAGPSKISLKGMTCDGCVKSLQKAVAQIPEASKVAIAIEKNLVTIEDSQQTLSPQQMMILKAKLEAAAKKLKFQVVRGQG